MVRSFITTIDLNGKTATGFRVPVDVAAALGPARRPRVRVTINGHTYRSTVAVYGGVSMLPLSAANRSAAGVKAGDTVEVTLEPDTEPRVVEIPDPLADALAGHPGALEAFRALSYSKQRERAEAVASAKRPDTVARRVAAILAELI